MGFISIDFRSAKELEARYADTAGALWNKIVYPNLKQLGHALGTYMRAELKDVKYTGEMERSIGADIQIGGAGQFIMEVGPVVEHSKYVRYGTRPHWAPIAPLKRWAAEKLGDENAAYAVQRSIAKYGTSTWAERLYGSKANDYPTRTLERGDTRRSIFAFGERVSKEIRQKLETGK